jgi:hypothetical protein
VLLCFAIQAHAAQVSDVQVNRDGERFLIDMHISINAPAPAVFRALQDYAAMARYNPDLRSARVEPTAAPDRVRLFTTIHTCVLIYCKTMHQEQIMTATASPDGGKLDADLVAHGGDFRSGHGLWIVRPCPTARALTCVDVRIELVPAFWVPPVIGPWVIRRTMVEEARRTSAGLEQMARRSRAEAREVGESAQGLLEPVLGVPVVVIAGNFAVPGRMVKPERLGERRVGIETDDA